MMRVNGVAMLAAILVGFHAQVHAQQPTFTSRSEIAEFLVAAGLKNATLLTDAQRVAIVPNARHAWTLGNVIGAFGEYALEGHSLQQVLAAEIASISQGCEGRIMSGSRPPKPIGDAIIARFAVSCDTADGTVNVNGTLVHGKSSGAFVEHAGKVAFADEIERADALVAATIEDVYSHD